MAECLNEKERILDKKHLDNLIRFGYNGYLAEA
jgi:hypothetical protein